MALDDADLEVGVIYHSHTRSDPYRPDRREPREIPRRRLCAMVGVANGDAKVCASTSATARSPTRSSKCADRGRRVRGAAACLPGVSSRFAGDLRFCPDCKLPLVLQSAGDEPDYKSERHQRLRKVKPQLSEGELVKVAWARNETEGEFIQGLLLEKIQHAAPQCQVDVPDFLAAEPRRDGADLQPDRREMLLQAGVVSPEPGSSPSTPGGCCCRPAGGAGHRRARRLGAVFGDSLSARRARARCARRRPSVGPVIARRMPPTAPPAAPAGAGGTRTGRRPPRPPRAPGDRLQSPSRAASASRRRLGGPLFAQAPAR